MAWTLILEYLDVMGLVLTAVKAGSGAIAGFFLKRMWEAIMGDEKHEAMCCIEGCTGFRTPGTKGLCMRCYKSAKAKVDSGLVTWERLAEVGLCEGVEQSAFDKMFKQTLEGENN